MQVIHRALVSALLTLALSPSASAQQLTPFKVGVSDAVNTVLPVWMAEATHGFADRNLTVEMQSMEGSLATKAMVAKEMDVLLQGAIGMIGASLNGGVDLVYVASEINHSGATLNVAPGIQNAADLKGKTIGDDQPGSIYRKPTAWINASPRSAAKAHRRSSPAAAAVLRTATASHRT